jgi:hypothetical protein
MVEIRTRVVRWAAAILFLAFPARAQNLVARKIVDPSDLSAGRGALGKVGDYFRANDRIRVASTISGRGRSLCTPKARPTVFIKRALDGFLDVPLKRPRSA